MSVSSATMFSRQWVSKNSGRILAPRVPIRKYGEAQRPYVETLEPEMAHKQGAATNIVVPNRLVANRGDGITFTPIDLGERSATLMYMGPGHTDGDIMVGVEDVLFMGGLIEEGTDPYFEDSFPDRWIDTLGAVLEFDRYRVFVPGNGEPVDRTSWSVSVTPW